MHRPPSPQTWQDYPVTVGVGLGAILFTAMWWGGTNVDYLFMDYRAWEGQFWRLVTPALLHTSFYHLVFNLYWLWTFGAVVEETFGKGRTIGIYVLLAAGPTLAEYAFNRGGVGLSGIGYGLFGFLLILSRRDPRLAGVVDNQTIVLFVAWFILCCVLTAANVWNVGNVAHFSGAVLGVLLGLTWTSERHKSTYGGVLVILSLMLFVLATVGRPYVNFTGGPAAELAERAYADLLAQENERAAQRLRQAVAMAPREGLYWYNLGVAQFRMGEMEPALESFQRAYELDRGNLEWRKTLAQHKLHSAYQKQVADDHVGAVKLYEESLALDENNASGWHNLALSQIRLKNWIAARTAIERAAKLEPKEDRHQTVRDSLRGQGE